MSRPLQDEEVHTEMKKMVAFIKQEALEKAKEIKIKADEEFNIEKAKLVRQENATIDALFQKKIKQFDVQRKIATSNHNNKSKVKVLQKRHDLLGQTYADTRLQLLQYTSDLNLYAPLMENLLLQGFLELLEQHVSIQCMERDVGLVTSLLDSIKQRYFEMTNIKITADVDSESPLPTSAIGGVIVSSHGGRIKVLNSLESRLQIAAEQLLPEMRITLYGKPPNRRFFD